MKVVQKCEKSPNGKHQPDGTLIRMEHITVCGIARIIIDVPCAHCGVVGQVECDLDDAMYPMEVIGGKNDSNP